MVLKIFLKDKKYLEGGQLISVKVIGVRDLSYEKDISMIIDSSVGVRMKKKKYDRKLYRL